MILYNGENYRIEIVRFKNLLGSIEYIKQAMQIIYFIKNLSVLKEFYRFLHLQLKYQNFCQRTLAKCQKSIALYPQYPNLMKTKNSLS